MSYKSTIGYCHTVSSLRILNQVTSALAQDYDSNNTLSELLSRPPHWLAKWGLSLLFLIILFLLCISYVIKLPSEVKGTLKITSSNNPKPVVAKSDGKLSVILARNQQWVSKGEGIAVVEEAQLYENLSSLERHLKHTSIAVETGTAIETTFIPQKHLGELQRPFDAYKIALSRYLYDVSRYKPNKQKINISENKLIEDIQQNTNSQIQQQDADIRISARDLDMNTTLHNQSVLSDAEYRAAESRYIIKSQSVYATKNQLNNSLLQSKAKENELLEVEKNAEFYRLDLVEQISNLQHQIFLWKQKNIITAPSEGRLELSPMVQTNQGIRPGEEIGYVVPPKTNEVYGSTLIGQENFGKVAKNKKAKIKLAGYPYHEYGIIEGTVDYISPVTTEGKYLVKIKLPATLETNIKIKIPYRDGLTGDCEIATDNKRLIELIFEPLIKLIKG